MATATTHFLDLDEVDANAKQVVIKLDSVEHKLTPITVQDWIANTKMIQSLQAAEGDVEKEIDAMISMITRSFKTLEHDTLKQLPLAKLNKIMEFARANNGEKVVEAEAAAEAKANPPAALSAPSTSGSSSPA